MPNLMPEHAGDAHLLDIVCHGSDPGPSRAALTDSRSLVFLQRELAPGRLSFALRVLRGRPMLDAIDLLNALPLGAMLIDEAGRRVGMNEHCVAPLDSLGVKVYEQVLCFPLAGQQARWIGAIQSVSDQATSLTLHFAAGDGRNWRIHLAPVRMLIARQDFEESRLVLATLETEQPSLERTAQAFADRYHLTPAEFAILVGLCRGKSPHLIASERASSIATVRTQLARIYAKTGLGSQRALLIAVRSGLDQGIDGPATGP